MDFVSCAYLQTKFPIFANQIKCAMSEKYKTDSDGLYFVSFSVVGWMDVFVRRKYKDILIDSISYCQQHKSLKIYCYCIMPSHVHFITYSEKGELSSILRDMKAFPAKAKPMALS